MAKKNNNQNENNTGQESFGTKLATFIIILIITMVWLAIISLLIKIDAGGIGTTLRPYLEEVPVVNLVLPTLSDEDIAYRERYPYKNIKEAVERINILEELVDKYSEENDDYARRLAELQAENDNLRHYEDEYEAYLAAKEAFDKMIVYNDKAPNTKEYLEWYQSMYPETAAKIFAELAEQKERSETIQTVADAVSKMETKQAAQMLEQFTSDVDFICRIFDCLKLAKVSELLNQMTKDDELFAARVANRWDKWLQGE